MQKLYTLKEVAEAWSVAERTVLNQVNKGLLKSFKIGCEWKFSEEQINDYLEIREVDKSKRRKQTA